ncbi:MAG: hypothetical protein LBE25_10830 [Arthrobacter sp.]|nr:hypothetical protein [Arthrobacter sp.]
MSKKQRRRKALADLKDAARTRQPVAIKIREGRGWNEDGVVLDVGKRWFLLAVIRDGAYPDGFQLRRTKDVRKVRVMTQFLPALVEDERWPLSWPGPALDLRDSRAFLPQLDGVATVVSIREFVRRPNSFWVGQLLGGGHKRFWLRTLSPECVWDDTHIRPKFDDLTQVDLFDDYSNALLRVAGPPDTFGHNDD